MIPSSRVAGVRRLAATRSSYAFFDDLVLLYPVYALLFADTGLSGWQISSLFVIWSATSIALEIPSGVWADVLSRRLLLSIGPLLTAGGYLLWTLTPSYWAFALGFVLWGVKGALGSGALEALLYEELQRLDAAGEYARIQGRAQAVGVLAALLATAGAAPVLAAGGYQAVGVASAGACLLTAIVATRFPEHRPATSPTDERDDSDEPGYLATLRAGFAQARTNPGVRRALLVVPAVVGVWGALDEYTPLLVHETGVAASTVPLLLIPIWAAVAVGGMLAGAARRLSAGRLAMLLLLAAVTLALGAVSGQPAGVVLVALAFGALQVASVVVDARLQERITGPSRATVTSLASLATDLTTVGVYLAYAAASPAGHGVAFALLASPYVAVAAWLGFSRRRRMVGG